MTYYCPDCKGELEQVAGCGSVSYFCDSCKTLISRQRILTEEQLQEETKEDQ